MLSAIGAFWTPIDPTGIQSLCQHDAIAKSARDRIGDQSDIQGEERYAGIECRLCRHARADVHFADRLQQRFSVFGGRLQPLQHGAGHFYYIPDALDRLATDTNPRSQRPRSLQWRRRAICKDLPARAARMQPASAIDCVPMVSFAIRRWVAATGSWREDLSDEHAWQLSQEFRLGVQFQWPVQFQRRRQLSAL